MSSMGGNTALLLQTRKTERNAIGESIPVWQTVCSLWGFLDLSSGNSSYSTYNAKIQESTHVFLCDYREIREKPEECRAISGGSVYDVMLMDDPVGLHSHLEIFLKYVGGQHGRMDG